MIDYTDTNFLEHAQQLKVKGCWGAGDIVKMYELANSYIKAIIPVIEKERIEKAISRGGKKVRAISVTYLYQIFANLYKTGGFPYAYKGKMYESLWLPEGYEIVYHHEIGDVVVKKSTQLDVWGDYCINL